MTDDKLAEMERLALNLRDAGNHYAGLPADVPAWPESGPVADARAAYKHASVEWERADGPDYVVGLFAELRRERAKSDELAAVTAAAQRYQPPGSPPPGGLLPLLEWVLCANEGAGEIVNMVAETLKAHGCCCPPEKYDQIPPMMYPEWIGCVVRAAVKKDRERVLGLLGRYWTFNDDQRHTHTWHEREDCLEKIRAGATT